MEVVDNMKRDLNVENIVDFFNNNKNQINDFNVKSLKEVIENMLNYFYNDYTENTMEKEMVGMGGFCDIVDGCEYQEYFNIKKIQFNSFYPSITLKLLENKKISFNIKEYGLLYTFITKNHKEIRKNKFISKEGSLTCKIFLNSLYMLSANKFTNYGINDAGMISKFGHNLCSYIFNNFKSDVIYIDTDHIILKNIDEKLETYLNDIDLPYDVSDVNFMIFNKKRFVIEEDGIFSIKGIDSKHKSYENYRFNIEKFRLLLLSKSRERKIQKILNK